MTLNLDSVFTFTRLCVICVQSLLAHGVTSEKMYMENVTGLTRSSGPDTGYTCYTISIQQS